VQFSAMRCGAVRCGAGQGATLKFVAVRLNEVQ